ncbi:DUF3231 family protein [Ornithinibacillus xuwenensis]|uniref:DUF3231 family protein n=1 Tax=Ornithinibacillus xuwenensis TaxID=3144668 RepID=A0ABU9XMF0_9BACI
MEENHNTRLTSSELSVVWSSYQNNSMAVCVLKYFAANVNNADIKSVVDYALASSEKNLQWSKDILKKDNQPIPIGLTDEDVSPTAPRLFSDEFYLYYLKNMAKIGLSIYGVALSTAANSEVRNFLSQAIQGSTDLYNKSANLLLSLGIFVRPPYVSPVKSVDVIDEKKYLKGIMKLNNNKRPLNVIEITHVEANIETNALGNALLAGFAQVAKSKKVRNYCTTGKDIAKKHIKLFATLLTDDDLPSPMPWALDITDSTIAPFSDKLIMFHSSLLIASSISNYATGSAASLRTDIQTDYVRLAAEVAQYSSDGVNIMIKNRWLEQPPQIPNHKKLAKG